MVGFMLESSFQSGKSALERRRLMISKCAGEKKIFSIERAVSKLLMLFLTIFILAGASNCFGAKSESKDKDIIAKWGTKFITRQDLEMRIKALPPEQQARFQSAEQKMVLLNSLVQVQIIGAEARAQKLDKNKNVALQIEDMTNTILAQEYMSRKLTGLGKTTDSEVESFYLAHQKEYVKPGQVKAQHILVKVNADAKPEEIAAATAKAEAIRKELLAGGDFAKLAEKYSDDPGSKSQGGDLEYFTKDQMIPEFANVAFSMKKDEISNPVKTVFGVHIIKVNDIVPEKQMDLKEATPAIRSRLDNEKREGIIVKELERLRNKYKVEIKGIKDSEPNKK